MIPNLRDVGEAVNIIYGHEIMKEGILFRGGTINELFDETELPNVNCIINLRIGADKEFKGFRQVHVPAVDSIENYQTSNGQVRNWANRVIQAMLADNSFPCLVHCTAGKDRTSVIVALLLLSVGVDKKLVIEEYLLTESVVNSKNIETAIKGIGNPENYIFDASAIKIFQKELLIN